MSDLISRQEAIDAIRKCTVQEVTPAHMLIARVEAMVELMLLPSAQPERKKGKWTTGENMPPMKHRNGELKKFLPSFKYCSCCGHKAFDDSDWGEQLFDWCPYCGAKMEG